MWIMLLCCWIKFMYNIFQLYVAIPNVWLAVSMFRVDLMIKHLSRTKYITHYTIDYNVPGHWIHVFYFKIIC